MNQHSRRMPWTEQENAVLCEFYPTIGQRVSSMLPGRSRAACSIHASHLGISRENDWAEAEDDLLRKYYPTLGPDASTKISGKSKSACKMRARTLGIRKGRSDGQSKKMLSLSGISRQRGLR